MGIGDWAQSPIPNHQSPQCIIIFKYQFNRIIYKIKKNFNIIKKILQIYKSNYRYIAPTRLYFFHIYYTKKNFFIINKY